MTRVKTRERASEPIPAGVRCFCRRLLSPFQGTLQIVSVGIGEAESTDGRRWILYAMHPSIVAHTGLSEVRIGCWTRTGGLRRSRVRGPARCDVIEQAADALVAALARCAGRVPFACSDRYECWLLDRAGRPLALLESAVTPDECQPIATARWFAGQRALREFGSASGDGHRLQQQIETAAGRRPLARWFRRDDSGAGIDDAARPLPAARFPPLLLREHWRDPDAAALVRAFLAWQAPELLQLHGLTEPLRRRLEAAAWAQPERVERAHRLYPRVLDHNALTATRVRARLTASSPRQSQPAEPFYSFSVD